MSQGSGALFSAKSPIMTAGFLAVYRTGSPVTKINKTGTRAEGIWHFHGFTSLRIEGGITPFLCLDKYDMEYVKGDGQWKILKFAYRLTFMTPNEKGWIKETMVASIAGSSANIPDKPTPYPMPYSLYRINIMQPPPLELYED